MEKLTQLLLEDDGLNSNAIKVMFEDSKGQFWVII
jgi:hypothetical protein